jgi:hypothetical protein
MPNGKDVLMRRNFAILRDREVAFYAEGLDEPLTIPLPPRNQPITSRSSES